MSTQPGRLENEQTVKAHDEDTSDWNEEEPDPVAWIDDRARRYASNRTWRRIQLWVPPDEIADPARWDKPNCPAYNFYADAFERGWRAHLTYDPDRDNAGSWEAYVGWNIYRKIDRGFFDAAVFVPKNSAIAYLRAVGSSHETAEQREAWVDMGRDGLDFDTIHALANDQSAPSPGPDSSSDGEPDDDDDPTDHADARSFEDGVDARLFLDKALEGVEWWAWWLDHYGIPQTEWSDHVPAEFIDGITDLSSFFSRALKRARATVESWEYGS